MPSAWVKATLVGTLLSALGISCIRAAQGTPEPGIVVGWGSMVLPYVESGTRFTAIAAGGFHSLALKSDGTVVAWGYNDFGQSTVPAGLSGVVAIAGGWFHSLALKSDGTVVAWGAGRLLRLA
jgi:alpha-tubulin suppressor-like RCC1 family protein